MKIAQIQVMFIYLNLVELLKQTEDFELDTMFVRQNFVSGHPVGSLIKN